MYQNNLHELWALLNFLLPSVFKDSEAFSKVFDLNVDDTDKKQNMIKQLHKILRCERAQQQSRRGRKARIMIYYYHLLLEAFLAALNSEHERVLISVCNTAVFLNAAMFGSLALSVMMPTGRPFMLRRLKKEVEKSLPPKEETILFTGKPTTAARADTLADMKAGRTTAVVASVGAAPPHTQQHTALRVGFVEALFASFDFVGARDATPVFREGVSSFARHHALPRVAIARCR